MRVLKKSYLLLFSLVLALNFGVSSNHFAEESSNNYKEIVYIDGVFYVKEKPANGWYIYEKIIYYFKDGKKFTGHIQIGKRYKYVVNGLYAYGYANGILYDYGSPVNGWKDDGIKEFYFKEGKKYTGTIKEDDGEKYIINGEYAKGYIKGLFYSNGKLGDWWYDDGTAWYFFRDGKKFTGYGVDENGKRYFVNGKYANGIYEGKFYKDGVETAGNVYVNGVFYVKGKPANGWYEDEDITFYFKEGKKFTGFIQIGKINKYIVNGRYAYGYANDIFYTYGVPVNGWQFDGIKKFYFKEGKKFTGTIKEDDEEKYIINGEYTRGYIRGLFYSDGKIANWWVNDGTAWYFFQDGKKFTGLGVDGNGERYFVNGKYANGDYEGKFYKDGVETTEKTYVNDIFYVNGKVVSGWYDDGTAWYFFQNGKKHTGEGKDNAGYHYFVNGKYGTGEYNGKVYIEGKEITPIKNGYKNGFFFVDSKLANWWHDDGKDWYFFKNGKKYTGVANDSAGTHRFVNGKYDNNVPAINMPQYYQSDARWGRKVYGIANMTRTGCVPTSLAMAFSGLGKPVTPVNVADVIYYNTKEFNVRMIGTSGAGADYAIKYYNFKNTVIKSKEQLVQALHSGNPVFALVGNGDFVRGYAYTHGIMLSGYQNGKTKAMDPDSAYNTNKWYNVDRIWDQRSTDPYDTMLGGSFMLIEKK